MYVQGVRVELLKALRFVKGIFFLFLKIYALNKCYVLKPKYLIFLS
jgi:hypothetical protein